MFATRRRLTRSLGIVLFALTLGPTSVFADSDAGHHALPHHHLALFLGGGVETKRGKEDHDKGLASGLQYELRFHERWGAGGVIELLGQETIREVVLAVPVSFHAGGLRIFAGPGVEFLPGKEKYLTRLGAGYELPLREHWSLAPEVIADLIEGGAVTWLSGAAIGYEF